ncbi:hypothetical protein MJN51_34020, partial [Salmonella enterica subsp. enterica serovar Kentucky]|nr:hypothetical protein [Salmonella enterica subsp. enterica serovar Kentucky]
NFFNDIRTRIRIHPDGHNVSRTVYNLLLSRAFVFHQSAVSPSAWQAVAENRGIYSLVAGTGVKIYYALSLHLPGVNMLNTCYHR